MLEIVCTKFLLEGVLNEMLNNTMIQSTARFTAPAGSTDQLARTLSWTTITLRAARHLGVGRSIRYVLTRPKDSCLVQSNLKSTEIK